MSMAIVVHLHNGIHINNHGKCRTALQWETMWQSVLTPTHTCTQITRHRQTLTTDPHSRHNT